MNRNARFWLILSAVLVLVVVIVGGSGGDGPPYDPRSVNPDGAKGVVETLERLGATVDLDRPVPAAESTTALMLQDRLTVEDQDLLRDWVRRGGVLVTADISNDLAARSVGVLQRPDEQRVIDRDFCSVEVLAEVQRLRSSGRLLDAVGVDSCFGDGNRAFVVADRFGDGTVVTVGSPDLFTNAQLDDEDTAVLALALLAPNRGDAHVTFIGRSVVEFGEQELTDLVPPRVWNAIWQLLAAFLVFALYRSRRLGGVVAEPVPVRIEGSELVLKAGVLSQRSKDPQSAAVLVRADVTTRARKALSVPPTDNDEALAERIATRTGLDVASVTHALLSPVVTDEELVRVTQALYEIDDRLYDDHPTTDPAPTLRTDQKANAHD